MTAIAPDERFYGSELVSTRKPDSGAFSYKFCQAGGIAIVFPLRFIYIRGTIVIHDGHRNQVNVSRFDSIRDQDVPEIYI